MFDIIKRAVVPLFDSRQSAFWTGTINVLVQLLLRGFAVAFPEQDMAQQAQQIADALAWMLFYAGGRVISAAAKPSSPTTIAASKASTDAPHSPGGEVKE